MYNFAAALTLNIRKLTQRLQDWIVAVAATFQQRWNAASHVHSHLIQSVHIKCPRWSKFPEFFVTVSLMMISWFQEVKPQKLLSKYSWTVRAVFPITKNGYSIWILSQTGYLFRLGSKFPNNDALLKKEKSCTVWLISSFRKLCAWHVVTPHHWPAHFGCFPQKSWHPSSLLQLAVQSAGTAEKWRCILCCLWLLPRLSNEPFDEVVVLLACKKKKKKQRTEQRHLRRDATRSQFSLNIHPIAMKLELFIELCMLI